MRRSEPRSIAAVMAALAMLAGCSGESAGESDEGWDAGWEWAWAYRIDDPAECESAAPEFTLGCLEAVMERWESEDAPPPPL